MRTLRPLAILLLGVLTLVACGDDSPGDYSDATREAFMTGCIEDGDDPNLVEVCECTYDRAVDEVPFDQFESIEQRLGRGESDVPDSIATLILECIREVSARRR